MNEPVRPYRGPWETIFFAWAALIVPFILVIWCAIRYRVCTGQPINRARASSPRSTARRRPIRSDSKARAYVADLSARIAEQTARNQRASEFLDWVTAMLWIGFVFVPMTSPSPSTSRLCWWTGAIS